MDSKGKLMERSQVGFPTFKRYEREDSRMDGVKEEERASGCVVVNGGTEEIFFLIRNLQDGDGQRTVSDGG